MARRYTDLIIEQTKERVSLGRALRERLKAGYTLGDARADLFAGAIVALVALPRAMATAASSLSLSREVSASSSRRNFDGVVGR